MIQRIQTIYLLIAIGAFITEFFSPLLKSSQSAVTGMYQDAQVMVKEDQISLVLLAVTCLLSILSIFLFKNRNVQKQLILITIILLLTGNGYTGYAILAPTQEITSLSQASIFPGLGSFMPLIALIVLVLAYRGVSKDEKIVKSMDRLRIIWQASVW